MKRLVYFVAEDWYFCSHRLELAKQAIDHGYEVHLVCNVHQHEREIVSAGVHLTPICIDRSSLGLLGNLRLFMTICKAFKRLQPDIVHNVAQKPVLIGSLAAKWVGVPKVVNALGGLGFSFISPTLKAKILRFGLSLFYRSLFNLPNMILILQNRDDYGLFTDQLKIRKERLALIRGAGVDINHFVYTALPETPVTRVALVARMLKDKGVLEFIHAAKLINAKLDNVIFELVGDVDSKNPNSLTVKELIELAAEAGVVWSGPSSDIYSVWARSHVSVLPSYREGLPKSLLESAAVGRAIIATDVPGCREVVNEGENGFLVPARSVVELADKIEILVKNRSLCEKMGKNSRAYVETDFSSSSVNASIIKLYKQHSY